MMNTVLIAEDEPILARNLAIAVERTGRRPTVANSWREAMDAIDLRAFALVCADVNLGDGCGLAMCRVARQRSPDARLLLFTGLDIAFHRAAAGRLHARFLAKPFSLSTFLTVIDELIPAEAGKPGST